MTNKFCQPAILIVFFTLTACLQTSDNEKIPQSYATTSNLNSIKNSNDTIINDTIFIHRKITKGIYHAIFIEKDRQSQYYHQLTNFTFGKYDLEGFQANYDAVKEKFPDKLKKYNLLDLPTEWIPLYKYKDQYHLYAPSDWGNAGKRIISDSVVVFWYMDGPDPAPIQSFKKINSDTYLLSFKNYYDTIADELKIHIIDTNKKIAIWEQTNFDENDIFRYQFYVPKENAKLFDIVINYCEKQKQLEFDFDTVDFKKILHRH